MVETGGSPAPSSPGTVQGDAGSEDLLGARTSHSQALGGLKQCELVLPSPAVAPKSNSVNITVVGSACRVWLPPDALCQLWNGTCFQGQSLLPCDHVLEDGRCHPWGFEKCLVTPTGTPGPCGCWAGRFGLCVGFRENALSIAALSSYRGGLVLRPSLS